MIAAEVWVVGESVLDIVSHADFTVAEHPGGSPANVAVGLARRVRATEFLTEVGDDEPGAALAAQRERAGVRVLNALSAVATPTAHAHINCDGAATYGFEIHWALEGERVDQITQVGHVHTGSLAALMDQGAPPLDVARARLASGPAMIVMTFGAHGYLVCLPHDELRVAAKATSVQVTVGAGDSFMSERIDGLCNAELLGRGRRESLRLADAATVRDVAAFAAARAAAITVSRAGANPPTRMELYAIIETQRKRTSEP